MSIIRREYQEGVLQARESTTTRDKRLVGSAQKTTAAMQEMARRKGMLVAANLHRANASAKKRERDRAGKQC